MIGQMLGHYRIDEQIGAGAMGVVYLAYDTRLQRRVAIKLVKDPAVSAEAAHRHLLAEARMASGLNHPHICTVHEGGEGDGSVFLVMEYVERRRLDTIIPPRGLPFDAVVRHGRAIAGALEHAQAHGVLHRDLKASNYCHAGNQPRLVSTGLVGDEIRFTLDRITNLSTPSAGHIHEAEFRFQTNGTFESRWVWRENGVDTSRTRGHGPSSLQTDPAPAFPTVR